MSDVVRLTLRLPLALADQLYAVRGRRSLNGEIVARLEASFAEAAPSDVPSAQAKEEAS